MGNTFAQLKVLVARDIRDPDHVTFDDEAVGDLVNAGVNEVGRIAPERFMEDIVPVADTLEYQVRAGIYATPVPEIEIRRVELWDNSTTPKRCIGRIVPASQGRLNASFMGWDLWGGMLRLTNAQEEQIDPAKHVIRVDGYAPYPQLVDDTQDSNMSSECEFAVRDYARVEALRRLVGDRTLFVQWQSGSHGTDISPAALLSDLSVAEQRWERRSRKLTVLREPA